MHSRGAGARLAAVLIPLFSISGASALVLQTVWMRWLTIALGSSSRAIAVVLAVFMAGLGCGAWLGGRLADREPSRSLRHFALAELGIAAWALLSIPLLREVLPAAAAFTARLFDLAGLPTPLRIALAVIVLLPPTVLMGATLPLLVRSAFGAGARPARGVGMLYAANTLGGAAGVFAATFALIPVLGLTGSAIAAGLADLLVALAALAFARRAVEDAPPAALEPESDPAFAGTLFALAAAGYCVSGFAGLALEIVVQRLLVVLAGSTVYAFAVMLTACLVGIAIGSAAASPLAERTARPLGWLALGLGALSVGIGAAVRLCDAEAWQAVGRWGKGIPGLGGWPYAFELTAYFVTLLPATVMLGAIVPFIGRVAGQVPGRLAERCGLAYGANTAGAILGAVLGGSLLVPVLGTGRAMTALAVLAGIAGLSIAIAAPGARRWPWALGTLALATSGLWAALGQDPVRSTLGALVEQQIGGRTELRYFREGPVQTVAVVEVESEAMLDHLRVIANRVSLTATALPSQRYMRLLGYLPGLWTAEPPRRALVICLGTGITASAVAEIPSVDHIDLAEISPEIVDAAPLMREVNHAVLEDPRVRLHVEDGRHILLSARGAWDLITLEPPPPRESGVVSLYTREFYDLCRARLAPGGVVAQWIPLHSQSARELGGLVRSFVEGFPHVLGFLPVERDLILLGSERPLQVDLQSLERRFEALRPERSLVGIGFEGVAPLLATAMIDRAGLLRFAGDAPAVTDDRPRVEYFLSEGKLPELPEIGALFADPPGLERLLRTAPPVELAESFRRARSALLALLRSELARASGRNDEAERLRREALAERPEDAYYLYSLSLSDAHLARLRERARESPDDPRPWLTLAVRASRRGLADQALGALREAQASAPDDPEVLLRLGLALVRRAGAESAEGRRLLERFLALAPAHAAAPSVRAELAQDQGP